MKFNNPFHKKQNYLTTIAIDTQNSAIHFYSRFGGESAEITHRVKGFNGGHYFDEEFFVHFKEAVREFAEEYPSEGVRKVSVILPDSAVVTDAVKIPTMKGIGQTKKTLDVTLGGLYRNYAELRVVTNVAAQNKQYATYAVTAVQKRIATSLYAACSENKLLVDTLTTAASATAGGAALLNPKLKNASYLLLDIKDTYARFVFVANGKAVGSYILPFGLEFLRKPAVTQEDLLFDHTFAELSVLNARETAKSKKLTVLAPDAVFEDEEEADGEETAPVAEGENPENPESDGTEEELVAMAEAVASGRQPVAKLYKKKARKLPKFMQREIPETEDGILYENFRIFVKWALTLIHNNEKLTELGKPEFVCVNIPDDLAPVLDKVNEEAEESGVTFTALPHGGAEGDVTANLELYGGLSPRAIGATGKL